MPSVQRHNLNKLQSYSLPSNQYVNLTLGVSGTEYVAPADGWILVQKVAGRTPCYLSLQGIVVSICYSNYDTNALSVTIPIHKGRNFSITYDAIGETKYFRFYYAKGSQPA